MKSEGVRIQTHNISELLKAMGMDDQHLELQCNYLGRSDA
jgi:hypothetical protein